MAPHTDQLKMLRVVVREDFTKNRCDALIMDIKYCMELLEQMDRDSVKKMEEFIKTHHHTNSSQSKHNHPRFANEKHSIQGKHGKTHSIC
ncbi:hypothetical protein PG989_013469 [Apiospora arundinis]